MLVLDALSGKTRCHGSRSRTGSRIIYIRPCVADFIRICFERENRVLMLKTLRC